MMSEMTENIELHAYRTSVAKDSDIEEYHEFNQGEGDCLNIQHSAKHENPVKENDFFTQYDFKSTKKDGGKKKKSRKKETPSNLMDIINSELAAVTAPIEENVITKVRHTSKQQSSYLMKTNSFTRRRSFRDYEEGWVKKNEPVNISPIFPRVLENTAPDSHVIPVQYVEPSNFNDIVANVNTQEQGRPKFLDIEIRNIKFKHHHQFTIEKLLCTKMINLYDEYTDIKRSLDDLSKDIKVSRETRDTLKNEFLKISPNKKEDIRFDRTVRKYTEELLNLKDKYSKKLQEEKEVIHKIVSLWSDIEMVREKTDHKESGLALNIIRNILPEDDFEQQWNEVFNTEFSDLLDRIEFEYVTKYMEYKEDKCTQNLDDSTKRRIKKPKLQIDEDALKEEVEVITNSLVTKDKITIDLIKDGTYRANEIGSDRVNKNEYFFEIYVDDLFVCESEHITENHDKLSDIEFVECFSVQILPKNTTISLLLAENGKEVSSIKINLADITKSFFISEFIAQDFTYNYIVEPYGKSVGSGYNIKEIASANKIRLKSSNLFKGSLYTNCVVNIKIGWNDKLNHNQDENVKSFMDVGRTLKRLMHGIDKPNTEVLLDIINKIYDKDVSNDEKIINTLRNVCKMEISNDDTFPIDKNSPEFIRLKLLHLRNIGELNNVDNKLIPLHASQISTELLNCLQKSRESDFDVQYFTDKYNEMDPIELQRFIGAKYVQKLNEKMIRNLNEHLLRKTHKDVVRDFKDLSLRSLFTNQSNLATLATISSGTKQQLIKDALVKEQEIRITVHRAFNLSDRSTAILEDEGNEEQIAGFKVRSLRPFVRLSYRGASAQTAAAIGCHPTWNQTVKINSRLDPLSCIHINIYDEHKVNISDGSDEERNTVRYRYYNKWIGALQIPLHGVLSLGSLHGTFKTTTPPILFGYDNASHTKDSQSLIPEITQLMKKETSFISLHITTSLSHLGGLHGYRQPIPNAEEDYVINHLNDFVTEFSNDFPSRHLLLTFIDSAGKNKCVTQFLQPIPLPDSECFPKHLKHRSESALSKSSGKSSSSKSSGRRKEESGEEKESIYSTVSWRNGEGQLGRMINACVRYVALIPTYEVTDTHTVTLMGLELLKVLHGSPLDHTILLASYFLYLGIRCWVAIGTGLPRGHSSYVLTKYDLATQKVVLVNDPVRSRGFLNKSDGNVWHVYDAVSGDRTELRDVACPLKTVDFVFDNDNIWVNVQTSQDCENVSFDLSRSSDWQPVFDRSIFVMRQPLVSDPALYSAPAELDNLQRQLESKLKDKVQRWRPHVNTVWNRYCSGLLREMLPYWEYWSFNPMEPKPGLSQRLKQLMVTYKIFGFPLNIPYVSTKSVISTVKSTGLHVCDDPNVEFGLAVEVYAYPNNVISVWVFMASISRL